MSLLRKIYYLLGPKQRRWARRLYYLPSDLFSASKDPLVPPKGLIFTGSGDFVGIGDQMLNHFKEHAGLQPDHQVLDIGCGIGRMARPLTRFLNEAGSYDGFDVVRDGIEWCQDAYTDHPNFNFKYIPLRNDLYNLETDAQAAQLAFPYANDSFDLVILTSVFTHMQPNEVTHYLSEISRVLKPDGRMFCTFFLLSEASREHLASSDQPFFAHHYEHHSLHDEQVKDANIAFDLDFIRSSLESVGMKADAVHPGWWAGLERRDCLDFQDVLIARKRS